MRSKNVYGPYETKTVLAQGATSVNGPHQGAWVHTKYGEDWFLHFQDKEAYGRVVHLQPLSWKDNWPVMGKMPKKGYCGEPFTTYTKPKSSSRTVVNPAESDEFNEPRLGLQWQWHANYSQQFGQPSSYGFFRLYNHKQPKEAKSLWTTPNLLLQKTPADSFTATAHVKVAAKKSGDCGGLVMMGRDYSALVICRKDDHFELQQRTCIGADKEHAENINILATLKATDKDRIDYEPAIYEDLYLQLTVREGARMTFAYSLDNLKFMPVGEEFLLKEGKWIGAKFGFVAVQPAGKGVKGWMDIDWIRITK